ncbi:hypothetical protein AVEN_119503-1, partial [Araneus ventricosus]
MPLLLTILRSTVTFQRWLKFGLTLCGDSGCLFSSLSLVYGDVLMMAEIRTDI